MKGLCKDISRQVKSEFLFEFNLFEFKTDVNLDRDA